MSFFNLFTRKDINTGVDYAKSTPGSLLIDVRTPEEHSSGHIPGSINIPSDHLQRLINQVQDTNTPLFLYCLSGARSDSAARALKHVGYANVTSIGGISRWKGPIEKGVRT